MSNIKLSNPFIELKPNNPTVEDEFVTNDDAQSTDYGIDLSTQDRFSIPSWNHEWNTPLRDSVHAVILFDNDEAADHDAGSTVWESGKWFLARIKKTIIIWKSWWKAVQYHDQRSDQDHYELLFRISTDLSNFNN